MQQDKAVSEGGGKETEGLLARAGRLSSAAVVV